MARCDYCDTEHGTRHGVMTQGLATITHQAQASCSCKDFSLASVAIRSSGDTCHVSRVTGGDSLETGVYPHPPATLHAIRISNIKWWPIHIAV